MKEYDLVVIGSGAGMNVAVKARQKEMHVALIESGPMGGTCLNKGCIPSKIFIHPADVIREMEGARNIGVHSSVKNVDFKVIHKRMWDHVLEGKQSMEKGVKADAGMDLYTEPGRFTAPKTIRSGKTTMHSDRIVVACGARPRVPPVPGLEETGFLTSETVFDIDEIPGSIIILGGGYIGCEFAHFFSSMGSKVTIVGRSPALLSREEPEVSMLLQEVMSRHTDLKLGHEAVSVSSSRKGKKVVFKDRKTKAEGEVEGDEILVATGVRSNADLIDAKAGGIKLDARGYVVANEYLETSVPGIWALGDIIGRNMFRHTANYESQVVWKNISTKRTKADEHAVPYAVFTHPQVAGVGMTEAEAKKSGKNILVGRGTFSDCAMGYAMAVEESLVKVVVDAENLRILGVRIVGPQASILLQPFVYLMNAGDGTFMPLAHSQIIHPALSEAVVGALNDLHDPDANPHNKQHNH